MNPELLLPVAFIAGFFGSGHCIGMCGPVVVLFESPAAAGDVRRGMPRRLAYNSGRLMFYVLLGAVAGAAGMVLTKMAGVSTGLSILRIIAAALVVALGLNLLFELRVLRYLELGGAAIWRRLSPLSRHVLPMVTPTRALAAGFLWGALPCGLVYSSVAIAATSGSAVWGAVIMATFWLGTLPALLLAGASAQQLGKWSAKPALRRLTGAAMILAGAFALAMPYLHVMGSPDDGQHHHSSMAQPAR